MKTEAPKQTEYSAEIEELLDSDRLPHLCLSKPNRTAYDRLRSLTVQSIADDWKMIDEEAGRACVAGLWLFHDFLDEARELSKTIQTPEGVYWSALACRREPDHSGSKECFKKLGSHDVFIPLHAAARQMALSTKIPHRTTDFLITGTAWDPFAFIDLCKACQLGLSPNSLLCRKIQMKEWQLLFDFCFRKAIGGGDRCRI